MNDCGVMRNDELRACKGKIASEKLRSLVNNRSKIESFNQSVKIWSKGNLYIATIIVDNQATQCQIDGCQRGKISFIPKKLNPSTEKNSTLLHT